MRAHVSHVSKPTQFIPARHARKTRLQEVREHPDFGWLVVLGVVFVAGFAFVASLG